MTSDITILADLIAAKNDQIVKMKRKWIGLKGPITLSVWIQKLLMLTKALGWLKYIQGIYVRLYLLVFLTVRRLKALPETLHMHVMGSVPLLCLKYLIPHPIHLLPHDLQGVARAVVGSHSVQAVSEDRHGDGLRAACVPEPVLHPVAQGLHRQLPVGDHLAEALSMLPGQTYLKREAPPGLYR